MIHGFWQKVFLVTALLAGSAFGKPTEADRATARELARDGYHALKRGDHATAADRFRRADALVHAPTLVVDLARALTGLGLLVEAQEKYQLVLREGVASDAPRSWHRAHQNARAELEALRPRLAWLTLVVGGSDRPSVTVDQVRLPDAALGVPRATNPGIRKIRVEAPGYVPETRSITLAEGERQRLELTLVLKPPDALSAQTVRAVPAPAPRPTEQEGLGARRALAYTALAAGGVGLVVGGVTGVLALNERAELDSACSGGRCPPEERDSVDAYQRLGTASGIGFGVAVLGVGTGITLLLTDDSKERPNQTSKRGAELRPYVGLGTIGAAGRY